MQSERFLVCDSGFGFSLTPETVHTYLDGRTYVPDEWQSNSMGTDTGCILQQVLCIGTSRLRTPWCSEVWCAPTRP